ncbi:MAG: DUF4351 domain-containing protein [Calothrix sp. C42_A2020_038]|nr:DUF4351 domain-containing protein [Calothrix sp. C42_A2020_038]
MCGRISTLSLLLSRSLMNEYPPKLSVSQSTAVLAGLVLDQELIKRLLRSDAMRESVIYQDIQQERALSIVMRQLSREVGTVPPAQLLKIQALDSTQLDNLAEALLDFNGLADLETWLAQDRG